jgi:hypothetical protein
MCLNLCNRQLGGGWQPRRGTMQHCGAGRRQQVGACAALAASHGCRPAPSHP